LQNTEDERKRIASDLHDSVNHELLTLKNQADNGKQIHSQEIEKVINDVRQVSRDLYPAMFDNIGLVASIEALCERMTETGLFTSCEINYTIKLSKRNELQLYRIIQEALNNTLKHANANAAKVTLDTVGNELNIEIKDNGIGFNSSEIMNNAKSFGIQSILQRARAIGGKPTFESNAQGTKLIFKTLLH
jgi:signal transduction histidine kinase